MEAQEDYTIHADKAKEPVNNRMLIWERKLLDFSLRNNLLNIKEGRRVTPLSATDIAHLEDDLQAGKDFLPLQDDSEKLKQLMYLYRESRTALEENGANILFVVFGTLKWYENDSSETPRYAPLLLLPVTIIRKGVQYFIRSNKEDITFNTTLVEMMKQFYSIDLSELNILPEDESGVDVDKILQIVSDCTQSQKRWEVVRDSKLGLFSFSKFVMWNDVHSNGEKMLENPIIRSLVEKHNVQEESEPAVDARVLDKEANPDEFAIPVDVDSSQLEAVVESGKGKSFILYGPPGTGKSQTITNMIANALYHGKKVLFVAEKMAALQVVQHRLAKIGLEPFCLEMHSNKSTKQHLLQQLQMALEAVHIKESPQFENISQQLRQQRERLNDYMSALHQKRASGLSLYDCITRYQTFEEQPLMVSEEFLNQTNAEQIEQVSASLKELDAVFQITGRPSEHPLQGLNIFDISLNVEVKLQSFLSSVKESIEATLRLLESMGITKKNLDNATLALHYCDCVNKLLEGYSEGVLGIDERSLRTSWKEASDKWFLPRYFSRRSLLQPLKTFKANISNEDIPVLLDTLDERRALMRALGLQQTPHYNNQDVESCRQLLKVVSENQNNYTFENEDLKLASEHLDSWLQSLDKAHDWSQWCIRRKKLQELHLQSSIDAIEKEGKNGKQTNDATLKGIYRQLAYTVIDSDKQLQMFNGVIFEEVIRNYRKLTTEFQELTKKELYYKLVADIPLQTMEPSAASEMGILKRYISSGGRGASIRKIFDQLPNLLPRLCPVMLMSPISVAQYVDLNNDLFDIVCFDEASQMPTSEAVGAISRGKALICVGDPKQMPPTSFFSTNAVDESEAEDDDMESILDDCITISLPSRYLKWHYRSRHESLIAFSNNEYYDGKLFTFPSVDDRVSKVQFVSVNGTYDYGKNRTNQAEADAITEEVVRRLKDSELRQHSIGIVSFSKVQQNLIEDVLTERLSKEPELEKLAFDVEEPIFIKNLENVQGDERDVILFSIGYGPDKDGKVSMNFGPLNNKGGERRLNVAVSRARKEMLIFSTLQPEMIDLNRTSALGVEGLKRFLEFAKNGRLSASSASAAANAEDLPFINAVAAEIEKMGYQVDKQVGRSSFRVDLAVIDPKDEGHYILGILCDGSNYYSTKTERDREVVQPGVLRGLKWNLMRVWSIDWFLNKDMVLQRIEAMLKAGTPPSIPTDVKLKTSPFSISKEEIVKVKEDKPFDRNGKDIEDIPASTIQQTLLHIVEQQIAIPLEDLFRLAAKQLGFARRGKRVDEAVENVLSTLLNDHQLSKDENGNIIKS